MLRLLPTLPSKLAGQPRWRRVTAALSAIGVVALAIGIVVGAGLPGSSKGASTPKTAGGSTTVQRRDLVATDTESGTLGYANPQTVFNRLSGTITGLPNVGQVIKPGQTLYQVDGAPVVLFNGSFPAYRDLTSSDSDGSDIQELNQNLIDLGFDPDRQITVNDTWQAGTTDAVEAWQSSLGQTETGSITLGQIVFLPGAQKVTTIDATLGGTGSSSGSGSSGSGSSGSSSSGTGTSSSSSGSGSSATSDTSIGSPRTDFVSLESTTPASSPAGQGAGTTGASGSAAGAPGAGATGASGSDSSTAASSAASSAASDPATLCNRTKTAAQRSSRPLLVTPQNCKGTRAAGSFTMNATPTTTTTTPTTTTTTPTTSGKGGTKSGNLSAQELAALIALLKAETLELKKSGGSAGGSAGGSGASAGGRSGGGSGGGGSSASGGGSSAAGGASAGGSSSGSSAATADPILDTTSNQLIVTVNLDATKQSEAVVKEPVTVQLPNGNTVDGKVTQVSPVAQSTSSSSSSGSGSSSSTPSATVPVTIALKGKLPPGNLDQAAVSVNFAQQVENNVLSVPVTALLATAGGGYAVQEANSPHKLIPVTPGLFAASYVQISGSEIYPGLQVTDSQG